MTSTPLPGHPHIAYRDDALFIEDCALSDLARQHGTPLYVYSKASMLDALAPTSGASPAARCRSAMR